MKKTILLIPVVVLLSGCFETVVVRHEPYPVYITVPTTQRPVEVSRCESEIDKLTDASDPGTVAMAYKHDVTCLRSKILQFETILTQYTADADAAEKTTAEIKQKFEELIVKYKQELQTIEAGSKVQQQ